MGYFGPQTRDRPPSALLEALNPITVAAADFDVQLVTKAGIRPWKVKIANESPYAVRVELAGYIDWIGPWTADVVPTGGATVMHVHPIVLGAALPPTPQSVLLVTLAPQGEDFPGTYPVALVRQASTYQQIVPLVITPGDSGIYTIQPNTVLTNAVFPIPANVQSVRWSINQLGANTKWSGSKVVGNVTGAPYNFGQTNAGGAGGFDENFALFPEDTALLFSIDTTGSANPVEYWFTATMGMGLVAARLTSTGTIDGLPVFVRNDSHPPPWQSANQLPLRQIINVAAGATGTVVPAPGAGLSIWLLSMMWYSTAASGAFGYIGDAALNPYAEWAQVAGVLGPFNLDGKGAKLPANTAIVCKNESGVAMNNLSVSTTYSIAA